MTNITLAAPKYPADFFCIYRLYRTAFPASERKPFFIILKMFRQRKSDLWCIRKSGRFVGFAATVNSPDLVLLDYLAVCEKHRRDGIGSSTLVQLKKIYEALFVEIESTDFPGEDHTLRLHRKQFYVRAGMVPMNVTANVFGVRMELLGWNCSLDFERYQSFYRDHYSPWAAEHIHKYEPL